MRHLELMWVATLVVGIGACGSDDGSGGGTSGTTEEGGSGGNASSQGGSTNGEGGSTTSEGGTSSTGAAAGEGGVAQGGGPGGGVGGSGATGECPQLAAATVATRLTIDVSWAATTGLEAGSGQMSVWTLSHLDFNGTTVSGSVRSCGSFIPPFTKSALAGGGRVQTVIPDAVWDTPSMPSFEANGTISGFDPGATITMQPVYALLGTVLNDPANDPWPASWTGLTPADPEGNGKPGVVANPRSDGDFDLPPLSLLGALDPNAPRANQLGLATRTAFELQGTRDSCTHAAGSVVVHAIDSHVVYCNAINVPEGNRDCAPNEVTFIDDNQPTFTAGNATYEMLQLAENASCADARAALP